MSVSLGLCDDKYAAIINHFVIAGSSVCWRLLGPCGGVTVASDAHEEEDDDDDEEEEDGVLRGRLRLCDPLLVNDDDDDDDDDDAAVTSPLAFVSARVSNVVDVRTGRRMTFLSSLSVTSL